MVGLGLGLAGAGRADRAAVGAPRAGDRARAADRPDWDDGIMGGVGGSLRARAVWGRL